MPDAVLYRDMTIHLVKRAEPAAGEPKADPNVLRFSVSSETPVMRWGDAEILRHDAASIRLDRLRSLGCAMVNHDPDQRAAAIISADIVDKRIEVTVRFGSTAFAQDVKRDVDDGLLRGISVGYRVHAWEVDEEKRTFTATDWEPFEVTFTPIPADATVGVGRSSSESWQSVRSLLSTNRAVSAAHPKETSMPENTQPAAPAPAPQAPAVVPAPAANDEASRAAVMQEIREVADLARSVELDPGLFLGMRKAEAQAAIISRMAEKNKTPPPVAAPISITVDQTDKARTAFTAALAHRSGIESPAFAAAQQNNPLLPGRGLRNLVKGYLRMTGVRTEEWENSDVAFFISGHPEMMGDQAQRSINISTGSFPNFVMLNAIKKIVARGLEMGSESSRYKEISEEQFVPDFKQFTIGGLGTANFQKTAEGLVLPELSKAEGYYNSTAKMWGGTLMVSMQALVNDDTNSFLRSLNSAGPILDKTIDKRVFQKLLMGTSTSEATSTYTSNTTSGGSLVYTTQDLMAAARGKLSLVRVALMNKIGLDGNPTANIPTHLIVPVTREMEALGITGGSGPGLQGGVAQSASSMKVVASTWLEFSGLVGYSTTSYYVLSKGATGLVVSKITGLEGIQVENMDVGAVAGMGWKFWSPFEADLVNVTNAAGTVIIPAVQQGTT